MPNQTYYSSHPILVIFRYLLLALCCTHAAYANAQVSLLSPSQGTTILGTSADFQWSSSETNIERWSLWIGTSPGGQDVFAQIVNGTSVTVSGLPANGTTLHVRLYSFSDAGWALEDTYQFVNSALSTPELLTPIDGATLTDSSATFQWTDNDLDIQRWSLWIGSSLGAQDVFAQVIDDTSKTVTGLPTDGSPLFVRLYSFNNGQWALEDTRKITSATISSPELLLPIEGGTLDDSSVIFEWTGNDLAIQTWSLWVGSAIGTRDHFAQVVDGTSKTVTGLPTDGSSLFVRLYSFKDGQWTLRDSRELVSATISAPEILLPVAGSTLDTSTVTFEWTGNDLDIQRWSLWVGSSPGAQDLFAQIVDDTSKTVTGLPTDGSPVFVRLYSFNAGVWALVDSNEYQAMFIDTTPPVDLNNYDLVFGDEFNAASLDTNKWSTAYLWGPFASINAEEQYYVDTGITDVNANWSPFTQNNGILTISAIPTDGNHVATDQPPENDAYWQQNPEYQYKDDYDPSAVNYLSGVIASHQSYSFTHGYVESRIKVPAGQGLWSAFWLHTFKFVEDVPEIDIMEHLGEPANVVHQTMHYFDIENNWQLISTPTHTVSTTDYSQNFHTYGVSWEPKNVDFFIDGQLVLSVPDTDFKIAKQAMHVIANLAVGGSWPGPPNTQTVFPAKLEIDHIRVYQKKSAGDINAQVLAQDYQLMFSDGFGGTALNDQKWNTSYLWGPFFPINNEEQYYPDILGTNLQTVNNPMDVSNGTLKITAEQIAESDLPQQPPLNDTYWTDNPTRQYNPDYGTSTGWVPEYTSGMITSYDSFKFVHGYVESRMKIPEGSGLWPAFWLLNGYYVGPQPEIDIMEARGSSTQEVHHSYHYNNNNGTLISSTEATQHPQSGSKYSDDFHRYGVEWQPGKIVWYIDRQVVHSITGPHVSLQLEYLIANLAVGGNYVSDVDPTVLPATLEIDYIRVWQRN